MEKAFTAEALELELSWATGSGLPICCISGLAVAEAGRGSECKALEEAIGSKLCGSSYWIFTKWRCGHGRQTVGRKLSYLCVLKTKQKP